MAKDPVCGMNVNEKLQSLNQNTKAKPTTSAAKLAKQLLTKTQRDTLLKF